MKINLGTTGVNFLVERLNRGRALGNLLARRVEADPGEVFADLAPWVSENAALRFENTFPDGPVQTLGEFAGFLANELTPTGLMVVEDDLSSKGDGYLAKQARKPNYFGSHLIWILSGPDPDPSDVVQLLSYSYSISLVAAIVPDVITPASETELSIDHLKTYASKASLIAVNAWDDTGFVCWRAKR
jgi:hypothetical protein